MKNFNEKLTKDLEARESKFKEIMDFITKLK